jgi:hypothetical protein
MQSDGYTGTAFTAQGRARLLFRATQDWTSTANGTAIEFFTTPNDSTGPLKRMVITQDGVVGIGRANPVESLDVDGNLRLGTGTTGCVQDRDGTVIAGTCSSDLRFKRDVEPLERVLDGFSRLRPVNFSWRADEFPEKHFGSGRSYGFIAQEVEEIFPEMVARDAEGYLAVNYSKLPLYTVAALNELKVAHEAELEQQRETLRMQQARIDQLERALCRLGAELGACD